jgi:hypothetical protein
MSARWGTAGGACGVTTEDHAGRGRCCPRGSDIVGNTKLAVAGAVAGGEVTAVRSATRFVAADDAGGARSFGNGYKPAWPPSLSSSAITQISSAATLSWMALVVSWIALPLRASKLIGVSHRRTSSSSASRCHCRRLDLIAGGRDREKSDGSGRANRRYGIVIACQTTPDTSPLIGGPTDYDLGSIQLGI